MATYVDNGAITPSEDIGQAVNEAAAAIAATGATVTTAVPEAIPDAVGLIPRLRRTEGGAPIRKALERAGTKNSSPSLAYALDLPAPPSGDVLSSILDELTEVRARMLGFMQDYDAIICPVSPWTARPHGFDPGRGSLQRVEPFHGLQRDRLARGYSEGRDRSGWSADWSADSGATVA